MWLLDARVGCLQHVAERDLEPQQGSYAPRFRYGVLSHRWEEDSEEPTFEDYRFQPPFHTNKGIRKIQALCRVAQDHGLDLVWSDTCCIDKRSSAELSEAINSMYRYYQRATICFAYLRDVSIDTLDNDFVKSEWFTRGWTLQELLAPNDLRFYDCNWNFLGDKKSLSQLISTATGIGEAVLSGHKQLQECSVAQRMSWAARRVTSRVEDRAYSLLGIFDVNMPMLYGEGAKAFMRLQEEIMKTVDDHTIFVWEGLRPEWPGLLAPSPDAFARSGSVVNIPERSGKQTYVVTNRGLKGWHKLYYYTLDTYVIWLPCARRHSTVGLMQVGIYLRRLYENDQFMRVSVRGKELVEDLMFMSSAEHFATHPTAHAISVRQSPLLREEMEYARRERTLGFRLNEGLLRRPGYVEALILGGFWYSEERLIHLLLPTLKIHRVSAIDIEQQEREIEIIRLGFDVDFNPVIYLTNRAVQYSEKKCNTTGSFLERFEGPSSEGKPAFETFVDGSPEESRWKEVQQLYPWYTSPGSGNALSQVRPSSKVDGLWVLKADRLQGLDARVVTEDDSPVARVRLKRALLDECVVWDLHIDELAPRFLNVKAVESSKALGGRSSRKRASSETE